MKIEAFDFAMEIKPALGGMVSSLDWAHKGRSFALLHAAGKNQAADSTAARHGLWPMTPFANRAFDGKLLMGGERFALPINDPADGSTMHGFGWQHAWKIIARSEASVELLHTYDLADPYAYEARFVISLEPARARFDLSVRNTGKSPLPFGIGFHPWFPRDSATRLQMTASAALRFGPRYRATGFGPLEPADDYGVDRAVPAETAVSFIEWDGAAVLTYPGTGLSLSISANETLRHPVLWTPLNAPFVCLEPQSHAIGAPSEAIVQAATPMTMLVPGAQISGWMALEPGVASS